MVRDVDPSVLTRASQYLYTRETKSSFAIEREEPPRNHMERFIRLLGQADDFEPTKEGLVHLQNAIVDPRFRDTDWRSEQIYVGDTRSDYQEVVRYVCPRPDDVPSLMSGWSDCLESMVDCHPVVSAAVASFGFVLIHPFRDGNGRIHRFLIHSTLANRDFTPPEIVFPVSSVMLRHRRDYERVLDEHAANIAPFVQFEVNAPGSLTVENETAKLYRYPDLTAFAEYLFQCIEETIEVDLVEELGFLGRFDAARAALRNIVDLPDAKARLLLTYLFQNRGQLSKSKRSDFHMLTDDEVADIEQALAPYANAS
jgi:Fic family protein